MYLLCDSVDMDGDWLDFVGVSGREEDGVVLKGVASEEVDLFLFLKGDFRLPGG